MNDKLSAAGPNLINLIKLKTWLKRFEPSVYRKIGGAPVLKALVNDFYQVMASDPLAKECLATHQGKDLKISAEKLFYFLSGWTGGPQLYLKTYGHPRLRMRHFSFAITSVEASQWLYCMEIAIKRSKIHAKYHEQLLDSFKGLTQMLQNKPG